LILDFFTFSTKVPLRFVTYLPKVRKIEKNFFFDPVTASSLVKTFWVTIWTSWVSKDAEFYVDFKNIHLS
jgi:hypothetical protein